MPNDYFELDSPLERFTNARADAVNSLFQGIEDGFDLLPSPSLFTGHRFNYAADSGAVNAYVVTISPEPTAYATGMTIDMYTTNTNTGASTVNVNGLGVKNILDSAGSALAAGAIVAGIANVLKYDGSAFRLQATVSTTVPANSSVTTDKLASTIYASEAEAIAGTDNEKLMTALRTAQYVGPQITAASATLTAAIAETEATAWWFACAY